MTALSWAARNRQRGAMSEREFMDAMRRLGFTLTDPMPDCVWTFTHPLTGARRYSVRNGETYRVALPRFRSAIHTVLAGRRKVIAGEEASP